MRIYIASSWRNDGCIGLARWLRGLGHQVDCFCDPSTGRYVFHWSELVPDESALREYDAVDFLRPEPVRRAYQEDRKWIDWAQAVLLYLPCGRSAHLEAGYAVGMGKRLVIYGQFEKGQFDVMYGFAHSMVRAGDLRGLEDALRDEPLHTRDQLWLRALASTMPAETARLVVDEFNALTDGTRDSWR